ncbi:MAG: hypothetical protein ABI068_16150, partial [Ktedonobacterales bacterium]
ESPSQTQAEAPIERVKGGDPVPSHAASASTGAGIAARRTIRRRWLVCGGIALLLALYVTLWAVSAFDNTNPTDLDVFFVPDVRIALAGHPLLIYSFRVEDYPIANGPISFLPLTLAAWLAARLGWLGDPHLRRMVIFIVCSPFPLLVGYETLRVTDRLLARPLRGVWRLLAYGAIALAPELWHSALYYGHIEQPLLVWLMLVGIRLLIERKPLWAGTLLGLALLTRTAAVLPLLALLLVLARWRRWNMLLRLLAGLAGTVALVMAPFLFVDERDVIYSLVTFRSSLPVGGGNLWGVLNWPGLIGFATRYDSTVTIGAALLLTVCVLVMRRDLDVDSADLYGLLALTMLCFPLFIKMLWPYYYLETYLFVAVWALARPLPYRRRGESAPPVMWVRWTWWALGWLWPAAVLVAAQVAEYGLSSNDFLGWIGPWSLINTLLLLGTMLTLLAMLLWGKPLRRWMEELATSRVAGAVGTGDEVVGDGGVSRGILMIDASSASE